MCPECGMTYSFVFQTQYHKAGCPALNASATIDKLKEKMLKGE